MLSIQLWKGIWAVSTSWLWGVGGSCHGLSLSLHQERNPTSGHTVSLGIPPHALSRPGRQILHASASRRIYSQSPRGRRGAGEVLSTGLQFALRGQHVLADKTGLEVEGGAGFVLKFFFLNENTLTAGNGRAL